MSACNSAVIATDVVYMRTIHEICVEYMGKRFRVQTLVLKPEEPLRKVGPK